MGRKAAPQPLALSDPTTPSDSSSLRQTIRQVHSPTAPAAASTATSPRSPRSPLSPFRLSPKRSPTITGDREKQTSQTSSDHSSKPRYLRKNSPSSTPSHSRVKSLSPTTLSQSQSQSQSHAQSANENNYDPSSRDAEAVSPYLPLAATLHQAARETPQTAQPEEEQTTNTNTNTNTNTHIVYQHRDQRQRDELKTPKTGGFFFNLHKSAKSYGGRPRSPSTRSLDRRQQHEFYPQQAPNPGGTSTTSSEAMSRGAAENPTMAGRIPRSDPSHADHSLQKPNPSHPSRSDLSLASTSAADYENISSAAQKPKPKPFGLLGRSKSQRDRDRNDRSLSRERRRDREPTLPPPAKLSDSASLSNSNALSVDRSASHGSSSLKTTPAQPQDRSFRDMMASSSRNRSEDRSVSRDVPSREQYREREQARMQPSSYREHHNGGGSTFFSGLKTSSTRAADMIRGGLFGKGHRGVTTPEKEPVVDDEHYVLKTINLPLVEQTRLTRISKRLEDSRDKTEFWMPAFPWRAIDYLNYKGCDVEGLYRVPGSGPQIKRWQRKFDEEYDVDLFAQEDLYDINIIGSMLKAWLRELPDEIFPKEAQDRIARECAGAETVPPMLVEELSKLSPFNYYLLFAITCHLSLLLAHSDKNKMDFRNLCICFQPCMRIDVFCFKFLVCDWRDCWKGCMNEAKFIEQEYLLFDQPPPHGLAEPRQPAQDKPAAATAGPITAGPAVEVHEERTVSSSDSSTPPSLSLSQNQSQNQESQKSRKKKNLQLPESNGDSSSSSPSASLTINSDRDAPRITNDLRPLSPIKPLSPMNF